MIASRCWGRNAAGCPAAKSSLGGQDGKRAIGVPAVQANLNLGWETPFIDGLALEGRAVYTASQYADAANTLSIPAWVRVDLGRAMR
ncbi:hypothetical protein O0544_03895 [Edwardsiella anguillarum]|nr:hypothetical protein [Edwardsiella anguillarum]